MDVFDPNILQRVFLEAILQVGIKKSIGDLGPECPFNVRLLVYLLPCWSSFKGRLTGFAPCRTVDMALYR